MSENTPSTNQEILTSAFQKAIDNGFGGFNMNEPWRIEGNFLRHVIAGEEFLSHINVYIFSHDFAKALWGYEGWCFRCRENMVTSTHKDWCPDSYDMGPVWEYHLMQMVIAPDPIAYLGAHI